jgi:hypothetical protein
MLREVCWNRCCAAGRVGTAVMLAADTVPICTLCFNTAVATLQSAECDLFSGGLVWFCPLEADVISAHVCVPYLPARQ